MIIRDMSKFDYMVTDADKVLVAEDYLRHVAVTEGWIDVGIHGIDWDEFYDVVRGYNFEPIGTFKDFKGEFTEVYLILRSDIDFRLAKRYFSNDSTNGFDLIDMAARCFHDSPTFEGENIFYYPINMLEDILYNYTATDILELKADNLDLLHDDYFLVTPFKEIVGLTTGEYIEHLRENESTILEHMKTWVI